MFQLFEGRTADEVWCQVATAFRRDIAARQLSRSGPTREILRAAISISKPRERWMVSRRPPMNPAFAIAETVWILTGKNEASFLNYFNRRLPDFAGSTPTYHGAYGHRLRKHFGVDQLSRAYMALKQNPETRQAVLQIWDATSDLPDASGRAVSADVPCNTMSMLKVRDGRLEWTQVMRSNDAFRGLPYNIVQFTTLQEVMAGWLGVEVGTYAQLSDSLHAYEDTFENIAASTSPFPGLEENIDSIAVSKETSDECFQELARVIELIIDDAVGVDRLRVEAVTTQLPTAFRNMLLVLCAEGIRRRRRIDVAVDVIENCTNPVMRLLFRLWCDRLHVGPAASHHAQNK